MAADFYKDKTVRVVVPSGSGGTYHLYCQILARHMGKHLGGGTASVITQNMPGAGGAKAARYMVTAAPKDGSVISMINPGSIAFPGLRPGVGFDTRKMRWLGSMSGRAYTVGVYNGSKGDSGFTAAEAAKKFGPPVRTIEDARKRTVIMGTSGKASTSYLMPSFMNKTLGTKFKIILGYKSGGTINLAMQKGEIEGRGNFYTGYLGVWPEAVRDNLVTFLARLGPDRDDMKHIPRLRNLMKTDLQRQMLDILEVSFLVGQAFYAPPGISKARLAELRAGFLGTVKDKGLLKDANKRHLPMNWQTHHQVQTSIDNIFKKPPTAFKTLATMLGFDKKKKKKK
jgi:tripartite-type tricarboxylate transporter receptor subunit TctC